MPPFRILPGFTRSAPGLEHALWQRLPAITLWGTALPLLLAGVNHLLSPGLDTGADDGALLLRDYLLVGVVLLHWTVVLTVGLGCFIVRVMKGPAYVADAYPPTERLDASPQSSRVDITSGSK